MTSVMITLPLHNVKFSTTKMRHEELINRLENKVEELELIIKKQKKEIDNLKNLIDLINQSHPSQKKFDL